MLAVWGAFAQESPGRIVNLAIQTSASEATRDPLSNSLGVDPFRPVRRLLHKRRMNLMTVWLSSRYY